MGTDWTPAFSGQRPPFAVGNEQSLAHGAYSPRTVGPLAERIEAEARASESWPQWLRDPSYGAAVASWAWAEATCRLLREFLADLDVGTMLSETATEDTTEERKGDRMTRRTVAQRKLSALEASRRWESIAAGRRRELGLDPLSRAKLGKDVAIGSAVAGQLERMQATGAELIAKYAPSALSAPETGVDEQGRQAHGDAAERASTADRSGDG